MEGKFGNMFNSIEERVEPEQAKVTGSWPSWLKGSFVRVGPGKFDFGDFTLNHWLDGMAILHKFQIDGDKVTFRSKYLRSDAYKKACLAQRPVFTEFGTHCYPDPCKNIFSRMFSQFEMTDNASSSVLCVEDQLFVSSETCYLRRVDSATLDTKEKVDLNKLMSVNFASSHPITDNTGTTYNVGASVMGHPRYNLVKVPPSKESNLTAGCDPWLNAKTIASVPSTWKTWYSYIHSFGLSENYLVFIEQPLLVNTLRLATSQLKSRSLSDCFEWHPQEKARFVVIKKSTGEVVKMRYVSEVPFFAFHHVNTLEIDGHLVVDIITYPAPTIINKLYLNKVRMNEYNNEDPPQLKRFVLPLISEKELQTAREGEELVKLPNTTASATKSAQGPSITITGIDIAEPGFDMPVINARHAARPYRYVYGTGAYDQGYYRNSICKVDVETGQTWLWRGNEHQYLAEPAFVPSPTGSQEDDGLILASVADVRKDSPDFLLVVDAKNMEELGRANIFDAQMPSSVHGVFLHDKL